MKMFGTFNQSRKFLNGQFEPALTKREFMISKSHFSFRWIDYILSFFKKSFAIKIKAANKISIIKEPKFNFNVTKLEKTKSAFLKQIDTAS